MLEAPSSTNYRKGENHASCRRCNIPEGGADVIPISPSHDEVVLVLEGECSFRVGDQTRRVKPGDLMLVPRDAVHGPLIDSGRVALLSVFAPFLDRTKKKIKGSRDGFA